LVGGCAVAERPATAPDSGSPVTPSDGPQQPDPDGPATVDPDGPTPPDTNTTPAGASLLISEVALTPAGGEFIEIINPTSSTVSLTDYYLSDSGNYFRLPAGTTVAQSDFIIKFNAGASIPAGGIVTVALDTAANFQTTYGVAPTFALGSGTMTSVVANSTPTLTNDGELVVLFKWGGASDLVSDSDLILAGRPTAANGLVDKSGIAIDGPDADSSATAYGTDTRTMAIQASIPPQGTSTKRIALETGFETTGTNGISGDDETSENTAMTWDSTFSAPTPGTVPAGLL
jgi:hypothetical protein